MEAQPVPTSRTSGSAIASLVCGLLGCVPMVTGLAAVVLGFIGIKKTSSPLVKGRGMAIAGLILGVLSIGGWSVFLAGLLMLSKLGAEEQVVAQQFTQDVSEGKIDAALAESVEGTDKAALTALNEQMKPWGTFTKLTKITALIEDVNGVKKTTVIGVASFATATKSYTIVVQKVGETNKVEKYEYK